MRIIIFLTLLFLFGCGDANRRPAKFHEGQFVIIKLDGKKGVIVSSPSRIDNNWRYPVNYVDSHGKIHQYYFREYELEKEE